MEQPIVYYTPTIAPSGIAFYTGNRYPGWKNNLFVAGLAGQQLRRLEIKGRQVVDQEVVFGQFGRTRAVYTGTGRSALHPAADPHRRRNRIGAARLHTRHDPSDSLP